MKSGLLVGKVCKSSGAANAGVRGARQEVTLAGVTWPLGGDIIVKVDGLRVASLDQLRTIVADKQPGDSVELELYRSTSTLDVKVKLGRQPALAPLLTPSLALHPWGPAPASPQASAVAGGWIEGPDRLPGALDSFREKLRFCTRLLA